MKQHPVANRCSVHGFINSLTTHLATISRQIQCCFNGTFTLHHIAKIFHGMVHYAGKIYNHLSNVYLVVAITLSIVKTVRKKNEKCNCRSVQTSPSFIIPGFLNATKPDKRNKARNTVFCQP